MKPFKFGIPAAKKLFHLVIIIICVLFLGIVLSYIAKIIPREEGWGMAKEGTQLASLLTHAATAILIIWFSWSLLVKVAAFVVPALTPEDIFIDVGGEKEAKPESKPEPPAIKEKAQIQQTTRALVDVLEGVRKGQKELNTARTDITVFTNHLIMEVRAVGEKAAEMNRQEKAITRVIDLLPARKEKATEFFAAIGALPDDQLRTLLMCESENADYMKELAKAVSLQLGVLQQWQAQYYLFAIKLIKSVAELKARLLDIQAAHTMADSHAFLSQAQEKLEGVNKYLTIDNEDWAAALEDARPIARLSATNGRFLPERRV